MALADILAKLGEDEESQGKKLEEMLQAAATAAELSTKVGQLSTSVQKLEEKRDDLLGQRQKLKKARDLLVENGIDPDDENAGTLLKAKLAAKGEKSSDSDLEVIEMRSALNRLTAQLNEIKEEADTSKKENAELKAKKIKDDIKQTVLSALGASSAGVCLSAGKLFQLNQSAFVMADDGSTVLWKDGESLKTLDDFAAASHSNPEDAIFWAGRGSSGSGTVPGRSGGGAPSTGGGSSGNPFETGGNGTQAAKMLKNDPRAAERLIAEARAKGKLCPVIQRMLAMRK